MATFADRNSPMVIAETRRAAIRRDPGLVYVCPNALFFYDVEGAGPDTFVRAASPEAAARAAAEHQGQGSLGRLDWLDAGSDERTIARYEWVGGELDGRVTVRRVDRELVAALDTMDLDDGEIVEAAPLRANVRRYAPMERV